MFSQRLHIYFPLLTILFFNLAAFSQTQSPAPVRPREKQPTKGVAAAFPAKAAGSKKFVLDVVRSAVALPQTDQQDRLQVLSSAINVTSPLAPKIAAEYAKEGVAIESQLIAVGKKPAVSVLAAGQADCKATVDFVQKLYPASVSAAEQSLIGALTRCPKQTGDMVRTRLDAALQQGILAPRLLMAAIDSQPEHSAWAQRSFAQLFSSLPNDPEKSRAEAPNFAAMFSTSAAKMDKDVVRDSGVNLLQWLGKLEQSGDRQLAINITTSSMKEALGEEGYKKALEKDVMARQAADLAGAAGESSHPEEESVSVLQAMSNSGTDQNEALKQMPPSLRARQAAAYGFATGTGGDRKSSDGYFDVAFSAIDEVWAKHGETNVAAVVEEVSEAAAHVDPIAALKRAQALQDPPAQAIGMIAVARVVLSNHLQ